MALGSTQPLVKMSTRNISGDKGGPCMRLTTSPPLRAECHRIWEPKPPGTLWATPGLLRDSLSFTVVNWKYLNYFSVIKQRSGNRNKKSLQRYATARFDVFTAVVLRFLYSGVVKTVWTVNMETLGSLETPVTSQHSVTSQKIWMFKSCILLWFFFAVLAWSFTDLWFI